MIPKICFTASVFLIVDGRVLLVKHKKINKWLGPGGHIDENELPHEAAEREFLEETGIKVQIYNPSKDFVARQLVARQLNEDLFHPLPFAISEHWVCQDNYSRRLVATEQNQQFIPNAQWSKGCEKHLNFTYLAKAIGSLEINPNEGESQEIAWFTVADLQDKYKNELASLVFVELLKAFELAK